MPKGKRPLDLNSLSSEVGESKGKGSLENKKRKSKNEDGGSAKKRKKDDGDGAKSELGLIEKQDEWSKELHGMSLALGNNESPFNVPKQPRGSLWRKKMECDQDGSLLGITNLVDHVGSFKVDDSVSKDIRDSDNDIEGNFVGLNKNTKRRVDPKSTMNSSGSNIKKGGAKETVEQVGAFKANVTKSENKGGPNGQQVKPDTLSVSNDMAGKIIGLEKKSRQKADGESTMKSSSSNVKPGKNIGADEKVEYVEVIEIEDTESEDEVSPNDLSVRSATPSADGESTMKSSSSNVKAGKNIGADETVEYVEVIEIEDTESEDEVSSNDLSVRSVTPSAGYDMVKKFDGLCKKSKQKVDPKSELNPRSSNVKLKKVRGDEALGHNGAFEDDDVPNDQLVKSISHSADKDEAGKVVALNKKSKLKVVGADKAIDSLEAPGAESISSEDKGGPADQSVRLGTFSAGKGGLSTSRLAGRDFGSCTKFKRKVDAKSTMKFSSSSAKLKQKVRAEEFKGKTDGQSNLIPYVEKESIPAVNYGVLPFKKRPGKKKDLLVGSPIKESQPAVASSDSDSPFVGSLDEDDDDDLEQNAARMLSSRFDPSCTGLSSNKKFSISQTVHELSLPVSSPSGGKFGSGDDNHRELRPRGADKSNGVLKKRRRFYEIPTQDMDPSWFLKCRIKVFWPLDACYYSGHVMGYRPEGKLHLVKYDDGDEEWLNLEKEKFRVFLYRFEIPGNGKTRKRSMVVKDTTHAEGSIKEEDDGNCIGNSPDSEPNASWLARESQRVEESSKSSKRRKKSQHHLAMVSSEKTDNPYGNMNISKLSVKRPGRESAPANKGLVFGNVNENLLLLLNGDNAIYVRKQVKVLSRGAKSRGTAPWPFTILSPDMISLPMSKRDMFVYCCLEGYHKHYWPAFIMLLESKEFNIQICLPLSYPEFLCGMVPFWVIRDIFMLKHGVITTTSPAVLLEMLVIDSNHGFRSLLFEGCLMQALPIVFQILTVFSHSNVHYPRKQHVFEVYCFSKLKSSKWRYMETKILQKCLLIKQLSSSECTYGNIKKHEYGVMLHLCRSRVGTSLSSREDFWPTGKHENVQFSFPFSAAPNSFLSLQLQSLVEHASDHQHQDLHVLSPVLADSQPNFIQDGFSNRPRKPRTQVQYTLPFAGTDLSSKQEMSSPKSIPCKRIRRASLKRIPNSAGNNQKNLECYDRNIRAASVKNIPIPGVRLLEEANDYGNEVSFVRNSTMYFRQSQTDAEMALDPSRVLYDMDSDDEQWLMTYKNCHGKNICEEISDESFEMAMDMFEKVSYAQHRENLTDSEIEELAIVLGSLEAAKLIYLHWQQKREKMCMPLIRHFQPPPWQRYEKQLKEWEHSIGQQKLPHPEKPPVFAFCFKPRGLDVPNKRSRRRISVSGLHLASGRRSNTTIRDDSDISTSLHPSTRNAHKNKQKKRTMGDRTNGEREKEGEGSKQPNIEEFHAREALSVLENARAIARLKRDTAQRLFCKAEHAIQNAVTHIMQAEALKGSSGNYQHST